MNYRKFYELKLGVVLSKDFHVHHMDFDRSNNCISNLVALPKNLHNQYHQLVRYADCMPSVLYFSGGVDVTFNVLQYIQVYKECNKWVIYKESFLSGIPNIYNLSY